MGTRGDLGRPQAGDLEGDAPGVFAPGDGGIRIVLDHVR
jgi:hypothetical protein